MSSAEKSKLLFYRDYQAFQGGHLKVFDYFTHAQHSETHNPFIFVRPGGLEPHLWSGLNGLMQAYEPEQADCLFIAGVDWDALSDYPEIEERIPVINLVQHLRHADPRDQRYRYLPRKAVRICVSEQVRDALTATGQCNGPIHVIPNGLNLHLLPDLPCTPLADVLIAGLKQPHMAIELCTKLRSHGLSVECLTTALPRREYLERVAAASIIVALPNRSEGFYLPALEAMAMSKAVICPDCVGNRSFCFDELTCLMPSYNVEALEASVLRVHLDPDLARSLRSAGQAISLKHGLEMEKASFLGILSNL